MDRGGKFDVSCGAKQIILAFIAKGKVAGH
jgi:hypothetical protein